MTRVLILVEGQTEETFVRDVLAPYYYQYDIFLIQKIVETKRTKSGTAFKGGVSSYAKVKRDVLRLLGDSNASAVTTMFDFYGLPNDFPGVSELPIGDCFQHVQHLENAFSEDINNTSFHPYLSLHEFEGLLFTSPYEINAMFPRSSAQGALENIRNSVNSPEEIDEGRTTHPSARLLSHLPTYRKRWHGPIIANRIGLDLIRKECSHFSTWTTWLESLT